MKTFLFAIILTVCSFTFYSCRYFSNEAINAFEEVNKGLITSGGFIETKADSLLQVINRTEGFDSLKLNAGKVKNVCTGYRNYIDTLKQEMVNRAGGYSESGEMLNRDDIDVATKMMVEEKRADTLMVQMALLKEQLTAFVKDSANALSIEMMFTLRGGKKEKTLSEYLFHHVPVSAAVTILSKFKNDAQNAECLVYEDIIRQMH